MSQPIEGGTAEVGPDTVQPTQTQVPVHDKEADGSKALKWTIRMILRWNLHKCNSCGSATFSVANARYCRVCDIEPAIDAAEKRRNLIMAEAERRTR